MDDLTRFLFGLAGGVVAMLLGVILGWNLSLVHLRRQIRRDQEAAERRYREAGMKLIPLLATARPRIWGRTEDGVTLLRDEHDEIVECNCGACDEARARRPSN